MPRGYWYESARPLTSLIFILPLLAFYEVGVLWLGPQAGRNAADVWLRQLLDAAGFSQYFLLPLLTCGLLLAWHHVSRQPWQWAWRVCGGMWFESAALGLLLVLVASWQTSLCSAACVPASIAATGPGRWLALLVGYIGAGIYEELLFRLLLLSGAVALLRVLGVPPRAAMVTAVLAVGLLFALAHYRVEFAVFGHRFGTTHGEPFVWGSFLFRWLAGGLFSVLFLVRGFGITVGTHALYDVFTLAC